MIIFQLPETRLKIDWSWLPRLERVLKREFKLGQQISLALVSSPEIKKLNARYRGKSETTDVLAFNLEDNGRVEKQQQLLGEIVICWSILKQQAKKYKRSLKQELQLLVVHGTLHLVGYRHQTAKQAGIMRRLEDKILTAL